MGGGTIYIYIYVIHIYIYISTISRRLLFGVRRGILIILVEGINSKVISCVIRTSKSSYTCPRFQSNGHVKMRQHGTKGEGVDYCQYNAIKEFTLKS